jgi:APA family basic amino acid/polyamine antiporter
MPRAGGSYLFASRGLSPIAGFIASFSQWFGLSIAIGVISYIIPAFMRDFFIALNYSDVASWLVGPVVRPILAIGLLWLFVYINILGGKSYAATLVPLMWLMFGSGVVAIIAAVFPITKPSPPEFQEAIQSVAGGAFDWQIFLTAAAVLFASFIGFDGIAQAGGEAINPEKNLPRAIAWAIGGVTLFYVLFTLSVYHLIPWQYVANQSQANDVTAPGLLASVLPFGWTMVILAGATIALINDLPGMILSVSRLMYAWGTDGIFPRWTAQLHPQHNTPHIAIILSGGMATIGILGSHFAGSFFLGIDIMVTAMIINYLMMCLTLLNIRERNPTLGSKVRLFSVKTQKVIGWCGASCLFIFLLIHITKDFSTDVEEWYFRSTWSYLFVMTIGALIFNLRKKKIHTQINQLP